MSENTLSKMDMLRSMQELDATIAEIEHIHQSKNHRAGTITCVIKGNVAVEAKSFIKILSAQIAILESMDKEASPDGKRRVEWLLTEAAVIGDQACFTVCGIDRDRLKELRKSADAGKSVEAKEGQS